VAKSKPIATKFGPVDHNAIGELPLRDHRLKFSQSTEKSNRMKNTVFPPQVLNHLDL
jgi:hypothetical protein